MYSTVCTHCECFFLVHNFRDFLNRICKYIKYISDFDEKNQIHHILFYQEENKSGTILITYTTSEMYNYFCIIIYKNWTDCVITSALSIAQARVHR